MGISRNFLLSIVVILCSTVATAAAQIDFEMIATDSGNAGIIRISGEITRTDEQKFRNVLASHPQISAVILDSSPGGLVQPALSIGEMIRSSNLATIASNFCQSACALIWLAGEPLLTVGENIVQFHAAYLGNGSTSPVGNAEIGAYLTRLGYERNVVRLVVTAPPDDFIPLSNGLAYAAGIDLIQISRIGDFSHFVEMAAQQTPNSDATKPHVDRTDDKSCDPNETAIWIAARDAQDRRLIITYLELFPEGCFADEATAQLEKLDYEPEDQRWWFASFKGVDFWGEDLTTKGIEVDSIEECAVSCAEENKCRLFTFNSRNKVCYPKSKVGIVISDPRALSGLVFLARANENGKPNPPVIIAEFESLPGKAYSGIRMPFWQPPTSVNSIDRCLRHCRSSSDCNFATYERSQGSGGRVCKVWRNRVTGIHNNRRAMSFRKIERRIEPTSEILDLGLVEPKFNRN